jgi:hypothetical protein
VFHDFLADRQPHTYTAVFTRAMQPLQDAEDLIYVLSGNPNTVVLDGTSPFNTVELSTNVDTRVHALPVILDSVLN